MSRVCGCGSCSDAIERATQFVCKAIDDDECALFAFAMCQAMMQIGDTIMHNQIRQITESGGMAGALSVALRADSLSEDVAKMFHSGPYIDILNEALTRYHKRRDETAKLVKGD